MNGHRIIYVCHATPNTASLSQLIKTWPIKPTVLLALVLLVSDDIEFYRTPVHINPNKDQHNRFRNNPGISVSHWILLYSRKRIRPEWFLVDDVGHTRTHRTRVYYQEGILGDCPDHLFHRKQVRAVAPGRSHGSQLA